MKPEDKARLDQHREHMTRSHRVECPCVHCFMLRIIDEQAADMAKLWAEGNAAGEALVELRGEMVEAESQLAEERAKRIEAERELAEERVKKCDYRAEYEAEYSKRTVAEARVVELDKALTDQREEYRHKREAATERLAAKVAELQALVDAADGLAFEGVSCANCEDGWSVSQFRNGCWNTEAMQLSKADAIALARDLAKKGPTR